MHTSEIFMSHYMAKKIKILYAEAIIITSLILNFPHFNIYINVQKNIMYLRKYSFPLWCYFQILPQFGMEILGGNKYEVLDNR